MKKIYTIQNLHCADCARSLEEAINSVDGVSCASINFLTEKFSVEYNTEETLEKLKKLIREFSSRVTLVEEETKKYSYQLKLIGLGCSSCAEGITKNVQKLSEVNTAEINFTTGVLKLELNKEPSEIVIKRIKSLIHTIEPKLKIKADAKKESSKINIRFILAVLGLMLAVPVFLAEYSLISLSNPLCYSIMILSVLMLGYNTYLTAIKMLKHFNINENLLVTISVFGAIIIGEGLEGIMVIALYTLGKFLEGKAVNRSREAIQELIKLSPEFAVVKRKDKEIKVHPKEVGVGETVVVRAGEKIPLDGVVVGGESNVNAQSLTGESKPIYKRQKSEVMSGMIVLDGVLEIKITKPESESTTTKIMNMIERASENKSRTETFISKFSKYYTLIVVVLAVAVGVVASLILNDYSAGIYRGLVFLVISCPCAFAISVPLSYFGGVGNASKKGILVKGTNYLDLVSKVKMVAFDKTGTLTTGEFKIKNVEVLEDAYSTEEVLNLAGIGEQYSIHPLAKCILNNIEAHSLPRAEKYHEVSGFGINYEYDGTEYFVGRDEEDSLDTTILVKKGNIKIAKIHLEDTIKDSSIKTIEELKSQKIKTIMLSGDNKNIVAQANKTLKMDEVHAEMLPEDKYTYLENARKLGKVIYVGDGINDAPSLALSDVGVSMGINGSGASIEASDVVIVDDDPAKIPELIKISKYTRKIVLQNIIFASVIKSSCLVLGTLGIAKMFMAVFADVGVTILAVLNSIRALKKK